MARHAQMAEPHKATWTHVNAYVVRGGFELADDGSTS